ncbi:MAG TPA: hypothetical protein VLA68_02500 [Nitrososphaera sp.]|nr:hypothetical protein [Nitrososphaera sp.]
MALTGADRKELELLIKAAMHDAGVPVGLARKMIPNQGNIEDFAYGLASGMVMGNFTALFQNKNGRELDRDEMVDMFSVMMTRMPHLRLAIKKHLEIR